MHTPSWLLCTFLHKTVYYFCLNNGHIIYYFVFYDIYFSYLFINYSIWYFCSWLAVLPFELSWQYASFIVWYLSKIEVRRSLSDSYLHLKAQRRSQPSNINRNDGWTVACFLSRVLYKKKKKKKKCQPTPLTLTKHQLVVLGGAVCWNYFLPTLAGHSACEQLDSNVTQRPNQNLCLSSESGHWRSYTEVLGWWINSPWESNSKKQQKYTVTNIQ